MYLYYVSFQDNEFCKKYDEMNRDWEGRARMRDDDIMVTLSIQPCSRRLREHQELSMACKSSEVKRCDELLCIASNTPPKIGSPPSLSQSGSYLHAIGDAKAMQIMSGAMLGAYPNVCSTDL